MWWAWRTHWTAGMSKVRPWPVRRPAVLRWAASSWLLMVGPSRLMTLTACGTVLCLGHGGESGLPSGFQASGHEAVFGLAGVEGAFGPVGVVTGAFHGEFGGPADPLVPAGDLVGGAQCKRNLLGGERLQQGGGDRGVDGGRDHGPAGRCGRPVGAGAALVRWSLVAVVVGAHRFSAAPTVDDPLT